MYIYVYTCIYIYIYIYIAVQLPHELHGQGPGVRDDVLPLR